MAPRNPTTRLLTTLGLGWLAFGGLGLGLRYAVQVPQVTVIIDQSYCPPVQWKISVLQPYRDLYEKSQANQRKIAQVVVVTGIDQTTLAKTPAPDELSKPFGQAPSPETLTALQQQFEETVVLKCGP
ncbi:hypothetical protein [Leptothoe spongobia]|uniref:Uncharacterized protein n=1 Tax=Leptothoe spongobia TAU-MAC 1115 TaxID=1967444 RepID=A0A947GMY0_9CYAN|nr:hypothetical protein [Leptothoe spongobia]MBT9315761.1 hypothetical protein [Leptothoe spongobia TAU-MAC 1115]